MPRLVLVLDPPSGALDALCAALRQEGGDATLVHGVGTASELLDTLGAGLRYDLVVVDTALGDGHGDAHELLRSLRALDPYLPVVATASNGDVDSAARAIEAGATDFLVRGPLLGARVATLLRKLHWILDLKDHNRRLTARLAERHRILGHSPVIRGLVSRIEAVAAIPRPVLVIGERGTGKELVAWNLHALGGSAGRPMVCVNCAAFSAGLLEAELFGHERGAYTGADSRAQGCFEQADGGTLFLDEIGAMPLPFQQKILRAVEYGLFRRVGGTTDVRTTARIVAATNVDLRARIAAGTFLPDLYDRLAFEVIEMPPLRARGDDVRLLAMAFLRQFEHEVPAVRDVEVADDVWGALSGHDWPGNVRELKHTIERAAYRHTDGVIRAVDLGLPSHASRTSARVEPQGFKARMESYKLDMLRTALVEAEGNQAEAARRLGLTYDQFRHHAKALSS